MTRFPAVFKIALFIIGVILFIPSSMFLYISIHNILDYGIDTGSVFTSDAQKQIETLKNGFITLIAIGLVIISILLIAFFNVFDEEKPKN
jgi:hypothetical protein